MSLDAVKTRGLVLLGCGKMGSALLQGWLEAGVPASSISIIDPNPSDWVRQTGAVVNGDLPDAPAVCLIAVKPQMMGEALDQISAFGGGETVFLSIAAGTSIAAFESAFGANTPIIRTMPNTPAAVGRGITAIIGNARVDEPALQLAESLLQAVGQTVRLTDEDQMDAVTAVSGSGPAYVFHMIETLAAAGEAEGLPADMAMALAKATVAGSGALAEAADETPEQLRINVSSPGGTTLAGLSVLMAKDGLPDLMRRTVAAAAQRSRELKG